MTLSSVVSCFHNSPVTYVLLILILGLTVTATISKHLFFKLILHPVSVFRKKEYYRLLSSDFVHNDAGHFLLNAFMLYAFGSDLEEHLRKHSNTGSSEFLFIYLFSLLTANLVTAISHRKDFKYSSAGASGSIMGCVFAFMLIDPNGTALNFAVIGPVKNIYTGVIYFVALGIYKWKRKNDLINHELHFYGALGGLVAALILFPNLL